MGGKRRPDLPSGWSCVSRRVRIWSGFRWRRAVRRSKSSDTASPKSHANHSLSRIINAHYQQQQPSSLCVYKHVLQYTFASIKPQRSLASPHFRAFMPIPHCAMHLSHFQQPSSNPKFFNKMFTFFYIFVYIKHFYPESKKKHCETWKIKWFS